MRSWTVHNPLFDTWFWTDSAVRRLLDNSFPPSLVQLYDSYPHAISRADLRKYVVLYAVGGLVADLDMECLRPVTALLDWLKSSRYSCVVSQEPQLHREFLYSSSNQPFVTTAIMACRPRHPFMRFVLNLLPEYAANADQLPWNENILNSTGPTFLSQAVRLYQAGYISPTGPAGQSNDRLLVADSRWFIPTYDPAHTAHFQTQCLLRWTTTGTQPAGCDRVLHNKPHSDSYTTHHWLHSWADGFVHGPTDNVTRLTRITRLVT